MPYSVTHIRFVKSLYVVTVLLFTVTISAFTQIEVKSINHRKLDLKGNALFFTNRPIIAPDSNSIKFKNKYTKRSGSLYFGWYNKDEKAYNLSMSVQNQLPKKVYPKTVPRDENIFYSIYEGLRLNQGIKDLVIIIPGFGKTFKAQTDGYMQKVQHLFADSLRNQNVAFATFAWGTVSSFIFYYKGKRVTKRATSDFAIYQVMLDEFLGDSDYFQTHPNDFKVHLLCTSMGNRLLRLYNVQRLQQGIPIQKSYTSIFLFGADVPWNAFEDGKGFDVLSQMADNSYVIVNRKDALLWFANYMNLKRRLGQRGMQNIDLKPENVHIVEIQSHIGINDLTTLGHDYLFSNEWMRQEVFNYFNKRHNMD